MSAGKTVHLLRLDAALPPAAKPILRAFCGFGDSRAHCPAELKLFTWDSPPPRAVTEPESRRCSVALVQDPPVMSDRLAAICNDLGRHFAPTLFEAHVGAGALGLHDYAYSFAYLALASVLHSNGVDTYQ